MCWEATIKHKKRGYGLFFYVAGYGVQITRYEPRNAQLVTRNYFSFISISKQIGVYSGMEGELPPAP